VPNSLSHYKQRTKTIPNESQDTESTIRRMDKAVLTGLLKRVSSSQRAEGHTTVAVPAGGVKKDANSVPADSRPQIVPEQD